MITTAQIPAGYVTIGQVTGNGVIELEDRARERGGDAISYPHMTSRGRFYCDVLKWEPK